MIDLYEILELDPSKSLTEIQEYLERNRTIWENNAHNRGDAESILKVRSLKEADIVFSSQVNRDRYDKELQEFLNPSIQSDPREVKCQEYFKKAEVYVKNKEFDLAEKAIYQAMSYREDSNIKVLKMAAHINDCLDNTEQALNYINEAIVIKPTDQQSYKLKLLILLHDFDIAKSVKFFDGTKLDQKKEATKQYILEGFIRGMNPQSDKEYLDSCDFILKSIKKSKHGSGFRALFNSTYKDSYRKMALSVREEKHYRVAVSQFYNPSSDNDFSTFQYCKSILKQSPNSQIAKEYIERYERRAEEQRLLQEKAEEEERIRRLKAEEELRHLTEYRNQLIKQRNQLEKIISVIRSEIQTLEENVSQLNEIRSSKIIELTEINYAPHGMDFLLIPIVYYVISIIVLFVVAIILALFSIEMSLGLANSVAITITIILYIIMILARLKESELKKQKDSLYKQIEEKEQTILSLRADLRTKEQSYAQLKQDIDNVSEQIDSTIKRANLPTQQALSWKSTTSNLSGAKNKIKVSSAKQ
ncbi:TPA: hypothetical protein TXN53_000905 [Streptococcus suis]|uniref:hypothetical protein n=1 Tax=Streptococcus suis TaxID=1307 RepID=UPI002A7B10DC|nr:hypothetical protein [Streptococcus suis]HEM2740865.1 hypothetical protein [Streptococcus suis]HEP1798574.1 hypothetical protein [Streptococcus suis]